MKTVKFKDAGKWAENDTNLPQFEVKAGEERLVSSALADIIVDAGRGKIIPAGKSQADKDKAAAEKKAADAKKNPATKDKGAAESK